MDPKLDLDPEEARDGTDNELSDDQEAAQAPLPEDGEPEDFPEARSCRLDVPEDELVVIDE